MTSPSDALSKEKDDAWRQALADATGNWAFVLSISRRMVFTLRCVRDGIGSDLFIHGKPSDLGPRSGHWIPAVGSLMKRGLVSHTVIEIPPDHREYGGPKTTSRYDLTPAGQCVVQLLIYAGLMEEKQPPVVLPAPRVTLKKRRAA